MNIIAKIISPFTEKFGIPRQPNLVTAGRCIVEFEPEFSDPAFIKDIEQHSHIWLLFLFHENIEQGWKASVRPPRLGGNKKTGVFATRSSFRPNAIGMSAVKLLRVESHTQSNSSNNKLQLVIESADLLNGTPIIDIKPYIPYSDGLLDATSGMAPSAPELSLTVEFTQQAATQLAENKNKYQELELLIRQVLQQDPRPAYKQNKTDDKIYGITLYDLNIKWRIDGSICQVIEIAHNM